MKIKFTELEDRVEDVAKESTELKKMIEENGNNDQKNQYASLNHVDAKIQGVKE